MNISEMKWVQPTKSYYGNQNQKDMTVSINQSTVKSTGIKEKNILSFTIRNDKGKLIAPSGYIECLLIGNRIYFRNNPNGFKLAKKIETVNHSYFKFMFKSYGYEYDDVKHYAGNYDLQYDKHENLYYIESKVQYTDNNGDEELKARYNINSRR